MKKNVHTPIQAVPAATGKYITAFSALKQAYGLQIKIAGCVTLRPAKSRSENVIGIVELDDQIVPILDARQTPAAPVTDVNCIVLFENKIGDTLIVTGRLYDCACQVFDLIVECMDNPAAHEQLYASSPAHLTPETAE
jgi:hypothetical protein